MSTKIRRFYAEIIESDGHKFRCKVPARNIREAKCNLSCPGRRVICVEPYNGQQTERHYDRPVFGRFPEFTDWERR